MRLHRVVEIHRTRMFPSYLTNQLPGGVVRRFIGSIPVNGEKPFTGFSGGSSPGRFENSVSVV